MPYNKCMQGTHFPLRLRLRSKCAPDARRYMALKV